MTQRYMHLSPAALDAAIRLLDRPGSDQKFGDVMETASRASTGKPSSPPSRFALRWTTFAWLANRSSRFRWLA